MVKLDDVASMPPAAIELATAFAAPPPPIAFGSGVVPVQAMAILDELAPWRLSTAFPWRIAAFRSPDAPPPSDLPALPEWERSGSGLDAAQMLPDRPRVRLEGAIRPGEGIDFYAVQLGGSTRALNISYNWMGPEAWRGPSRIWLADADGNIIDSWVLDPSFAGIELRMRALRRPEPTVLYLGIEATGAAGGGGLPMQYALEVQRMAGGGASFQFPMMSPISTGPPISDEGYLGGGLGGEPGTVFGPSFPSGAGLGLGPLGSSGGNGFRLGLREVGAPIPTGLGSRLIRPLPTQAAASVGGLLPAGPAIRYDSGAPDRVPPSDPYGDPLALAVEPVLPADPDRPADEGEIGLARFDGTTDPDGFAVEAGPGPIGSNPASTALPVRLAGGGGIPILVAGLRMAWGLPATSEIALPPLADPGAEPVGELAAIAAVSLPEAPGVLPGPVVPPIPRNDPEAAPLRPRVLRTVVFGAVALAVGLILPDLAADAPSLRRRGARALRPWRHA